MEIEMNEVILPARWLVYVACYCVPKPHSALIASFESFEDAIEFVGNSQEYYAEDVFTIIQI